MYGKHRIRGARVPDRICTGKSCGESDEKVRDICPGVHPGWDPADRRHQEGRRQVECIYQPHEALARDRHRVGWQNRMMKRRLAYMRKRLCLLKRRRGKKSKRSMRDDIVVYIALGTVLVASLTAVALYVALPTLQSLWRL